MKSFFLFLILTLIFQSWTKADEISDFAIEGMSIGDSALDTFEKEIIISSIKKSSYSDDKFYDVSLDINNSKYDYFLLSFKKNDQRYLIYSLSGVIEMPFNECIKEKDLVIKDIKKSFENFKEEDYTNRYAGKFGKSFAKITDLNVQSGSLRIWCDNFDKNHEIAKQWSNALNIDVSSEEFLFWLNNSAYK